MAKKIIKEETQEVAEDSAAMDSLKPNSKPVDDPKSRYETLAAMIGAAATMKDEHLTKWYNEMISASGSQHGAGIPDGAAAKNAATLAMKTVAKEDIEKIMADQDGLSEEFKTKATTLFEAALDARVNFEVERITEEVTNALEEEAAQILEQHENEMLVKVDEYLNYVAEQWLEENEVAITSTLHQEISEDFMTGLKDLFEQHYISIPEEKVDVVEELSKTVDEMETRLNDLIAENAELKTNLAATSRKDIVEEACQGLTMVEQEKLKEFAGNIDTDDMSAFKTKIETLKESHFVKGTKKSVLNEQLEEVDEDNAPVEEKKYSDPSMKRYAEAISRTIKR